MSEQQGQQQPVINLKLPGEFGAEEIQQVKVDHNRLSPAAEQAWGWQSMFRLPSDWYEVFTKSGTVVATGALFSSLLVQLVVAPELIIPIAIALLTISLVIVAAALRYKSIRLNVGVYFLLLALGSVLGVIHVILELL